MRHSAVRGRAAHCAYSPGRHNLPGAQADARNQVAAVSRPGSRPPAVGAPSLDANQRAGQAATLSSEAIRLVRGALASGEVARRGQGAGVVLAEHLAAAGQGVLVQVAGRLMLAKVG
jgi:hypothetical protein